MNNGGSAFPVFDNYGHGQEPDYGCASPGMSLRDWFAGQSLAIFPRIGDMEDLENAYDVRSDIAKFAYAMADTMIAQREDENRKQEEKA
jgi:hypothetical protein